jgi:hypothetical protein
MSSLSTRYPMQSVVVRTPRHTVPTGITAASLSAEPTAIEATVAFFHSRGFAVTTEERVKTRSRARVFIGPVAGELLFHQPHGRGHGLIDQSWVRGIRRPKEKNVCPACGHLDSGLAIPETTAVVAIH